MNTDVMQRLLCLICSDGDFVPDKSGLANRIFSTLQRMMQGRHTIDARVPCFCCMRQPPSATAISTSTRPRPVIVSPA